MYSVEHINYLKKIKKTSFFVRLTQISIILLFIVVWQWLADKNIINTFISSSPKEVVTQLLTYTTRIIYIIIYG